MPILISICFSCLRVTASKNSSMVPTHPGSMITISERSKRIFLRSSMVCVIISSHPTLLSVSALSLFKRNSGMIHTTSHHHATAPRMIDHIIPKVQPPYTRVCFFSARNFPNSKALSIYFCSIPSLAPQKRHIFAIFFEL